MVGGFKMLQVFLVCLTFYVHPYVHGLMDFNWLIYWMLFSQPWESLLWKHEVHLHLWYPHRSCPNSGELRPTNVFPLWACHVWSCEESSLCRYSRGSWHLRVLQQLLCGHFGRTSGINGSFSKDAKQSKKVQDGSSTQWLCNLEETWAKTSTC